jgi:hypothetical protein
VNSEELERSLRTEFESYLKDALADVRQEVSGLQETIEAEFEKHRSQLDTVFQDFASRLGSDKDLSPAFTESVVEHLRLARDEGARITATALAEAEAMQEAAPPAPADFSEIRDAIVDISSKNSQSAILKSLIQHAAEFTPRGAFFIIKNEHFVGWRVFGKEGNTDEHAVREVHFPISDDTVLGQSVRSLGTAEGAFGTYSDDAEYLNKLEFGQPDKMFAIPLVARGRGVAVLYADYGTEGVSVNVEALESLVSIAGLTVELLAAAQGAKAQPEAHEDTHDLHDEEFGGAAEPEVEETDGEPGAFNAPADGEFAYTEPAAEETAEPAGETAEEEDHGFAYSEPVAEENVEDESVGEESVEEEEPVAEEAIAEEEPAAGYEAEPSKEEVYPWDSAEPVTAFEPAAAEAPAAEAAAEEEFTSEPAAEYEFESTGSSLDTAVEEEEAPAAASWDSKPFESAPEYVATERAGDEKAESFESQNGDSEAYAPQPVVEPIVETVSAQPVKTRFSDRNVDLPIEVAEDERRLHNDARRFARLLVSEVKLYNEQKVKEGREANDLYDRLREAIDRSREMYDKRVQPPVASKFDYFHYELVSTLAEGDEQRLGESYPGATV